MILARVELDFRAPVGLGEELEIGVRPGGWGRRASTSSTRCAAASARRQGATVLVGYDYARVERDPGRVARAAGGMSLRAVNSANGVRTADGADAERAVDLVLPDVRGRVALRDRLERDRALRRAHVLQGHRAAAHLARHLGRDRLDRRRVQRLHRQGVHGYYVSCAAEHRHSRSTCSSTCSATRGSSRRRSSARRA